MAKASYYHEPKGHFGLAFCTTISFHLIQSERILEYDGSSATLSFIWTNGKFTLKLKAGNQKCSSFIRAGKRAADAERASIKYKGSGIHVFLLGKKITMESVSGITEWGSLCEITKTQRAQGMIDVRSDMILISTYLFDRKNMPD